MVLPAQLEDSASGVDRRTSARRTLKLRVPASATSGSGVAVLVHDISRSGLLIETDASLAIGTELDVDFPEVGPRTATIVWNRDQFFGCEFHEPLSQAGLSATFLKSSPGLESRAGSDLIHTEADYDDLESEKLPLRTRLTVIIALALAAWAACIAVYLLIQS